MSDCIRREAVHDYMDAMKQYIEELNLERDDHKGLMKWIDEMDSELPSVTPEKKPKKCGDCISREATLAKFKKYYFDDDTVIRCAELVIGSMPSVEPESKWIPVTERLPEDFGTYLITLEDGDVCKCDFNPDFWDEDNNREGAFTYYHQYFDSETLGMIDEEEEAVDAIAWMPFEPYKAESEDMG